MTKLKKLICLALSAVMVFTLAACGSTFDGNYKEVTGEEYNTTVADAQAAFKSGINGLLDGKTASGNKDVRLAAANETAASGAKAELKINLEYKESGGKKVRYDAKTSEEICVNNDKLEMAAKSEVKIKSTIKETIDSTLKSEVYSKDGNLYLNVKAENKGFKATDPMDSKLKVTTAFTGALSVSVKDIVNFGMLTEFAGEIVMESAEALREAGVKVYMDKTDDMTKIKYAVDKDAYAKLGIGDRKAELELKEYYVIVVLDNNKGLVGVKVKCDVKATRNEKEITTTKVEGFVEKTDKGVKFPSFDKYEEATLENVTTTAKGIVDFFLTIAQSTGDLFE